MPDSAPSRFLSSKLVVAAGGLVWRAGPRGREVALVRRPRHGGDWTLPKGKLEPGETLEECALREVREEVGNEAQLGEFADVVTYPVQGGVPKAVFYWHMKAGGERQEKDEDEVAEVAWLVPDEGVERLTYPRERELLRKASGLVERTAPGWWSRVINHLGGSPLRERL